MSFDILESSIPSLGNTWLNEEVNCVFVEENEYFVSEYSVEESYIATHGLHVCKGIAIYSPESKRGLLAHLSHVEQLDSSLETLVSAFAQDITTAEVTIVMAIQDREEGLWATTVDEIADQFTDLGANNINIDRNRSNRIIRGIAFNLEDGRVSELETEDPWGNIRIKNRRGTQIEINALYPYI